MKSGICFAIAVLSANLVVLSSYVDVAYRKHRIRVLLELEEVLLRRYYDRRNVQR